jgi:hypothetical protein
MSEKLNTAIAVIGIDIGKNSFHVLASQDRVPGTFDSDARYSPSGFDEIYRRRRDAFGRLHQDMV